MDKVKKWLGFLLSIFSCSLLSLTISAPANAYDLTLTDFDTIYTSVNTPYCQYNYLGNWGTQWNNESSEAIYNDGITYGGINGWRCRSGNNNDLYTQEGDIWVQYFRVVDYFSGTGVSSVQEQNLYSHITYFYDVVLGTDENNIIDFQLVGETNDRNRRTQYYRVVGRILENTRNPDWGIQVRRDPVVPAQTSGTFWTRVVVMSQQQYRPKERLDYTNQLDDILEAIDDISTATGVKEGVEQAMEDEKDQIQDASDEAEDSANDSQDDIDGASSSLLSVLTNFLGVLTSVNPSNCYLDGSIFPHLNLGQLNLCENSPPAAITALGSLLLIAFVIPLVYNTIKMMINLFSEFQR